jgi:3-methyladenine DNA glycosylase/8-oxoguanine DNA glycosylase
LLGVAELGRSGVLAGLDLMSDQEVRALVLPVFGIGPWTADMLLIFGLGRLDVWPVTDLGLRVGVAMSYPEEQPLALGERFAPYRSAAAWYFWNLADQNQRVKLNKP